MDIAQNLNRVKSLIPSSIPASLPAIVEKIKHKGAIVDKKKLAYSFGLVAGIYALIFTLVSLTSEGTRKKLEDKMSIVTVELSTKALEPTRHEINRQAIAKAKLIDGLSRYEEIAGQLPIIRQSDHLTSFRAYQTPFSLEAIGNKQVVSFIIKDFGLSVKESNIALDILPAEISFLLSPYAALPQEWINRAREKGHEVWLEIPIQASDNNDRGLNTIYHHDSLIEKGKTLRTTLARGLGYVGVGIFTDQTLLEIDDHYKRLTQEIYGRGLAIFEANPNAPDLVEILAVTKAAPYIKADSELLRMKGKKSFDAIEALVKKEKQAIAIVPPYPTIIKDLALWIEKVGKIDYVIAPVSAIYDLPLARSGAIVAQKKPRTTKPHIKKSPSPLNDNDHAEPVSHSNKTRH